MITKIYRLSVREIDKNARPPLKKLVYELTYREVLPKDITQPITEVIYLCNRAVHGQEVRIQDAKSIVDIGISLLSYLNGFIHDYTIKPSEVLEISQQELSNYKNAKYRVVSIIPYVERPVKNVRIVTQEGLDQLLEGYVEYAEFIVEVSRIDE
ncbi:hypothetical protein [Thermincola potens]|uniref:DUF4145 domain-containing protein n=1 Tax=Thermincola potens (strain JR) TaxID=635013 RepID=D5XC04_THEPJ|nr:hypothetical protein [Thermincola potens]ADG81552.1 hypothetical protein TherJR_0682 [Thermincola potens JR]